MTSTKYTNTYYNKFLLQYVSCTKFLSDWENIYICSLMQYFNMQQYQLDTEQKYITS
jgi:hypothetical protein